jgi:hypothetical protein
MDKRRSAGTVSCRSNTITMSLSGGVVLDARGPSTGRSMGSNSGAVFQGIESSAQSKGASSRSYSRSLADKGMGMDGVVSQSCNNGCLSVVSQGRHDRCGQVVSGYSQSIREADNPRF